jgi:DNA polymerase-3 subunit beta
MEFSDGKVSISANNPDLGEAVEDIEAEYKGKLISIGFNARYLMDVLGVLHGDGEIEIELKDELSPSVIRKNGVDGYLYVLMPMRL